MRRAPRALRLSLAALSRRRALRELAEEQRSSDRFFDEDEDEGHMLVQTGLLRKMYANSEDWLLLLWTAVLSTYVARLVSLAEQTNEKYNNTGVLLTEQLNLYITMLRNPAQKEELSVCSNVIRIAIQLLKDLELGKKKRGTVAMNPFVFSLLRVVLLSAFGGISSELLGFKLRLWKI